MAKLVNTLNNRIKKKKTNCFHVLASIAFYHVWKAHTLSPLQTHTSQLGHVRTHGNVLSVPL